LNIPLPFIFDLDSPKDHPDFYSVLISISDFMLYPLGAGVFILPLVKSDFFPYPNAAFLKDLESAFS
tara:strand:+ start:66 stop:266 length:201 start_codon:yes stop_codon:yes gene_type:complete